jgi:2-polyprenyl-3-methyl-5-hydroxy-6-metoxy-1,4-benzoquinol methylase
VLAKIMQLRSRERRAEGLTRAQQRDWDGLATHNALGAILRDPAHVRNPWDVDAFFATGDADLEVLFAAAARHGLPRRHGRALDFGCGVGRLSRGLAKRFDEVVGLDISPVMISSARRLNRELPNCSFEVSTDSGLSRLDSGSFDLVLCLLVLQHLPTGAEAERYIREFVRVVSTGGAVIFQTPSQVPLRRRVQSRRRLYTALRALGLPERLLLGPGRLDPIRTTAIAEQRVRNAVEESGGIILESEPDAAAGPHIPGRRYLAARP